MMSLVLRLWDAGLSLDLELFPALPLLLVIGILALIITNHYLRDRKARRDQREGRPSGPEDASEE